MAYLFLGQAKSTVDILQLATNCPKFENLKLLPSRVRSVVSEEAFRVFASALGVTDPTLTAKNMCDLHLHLLCEEFEFVTLHTKVTDLISVHSVIDNEAGFVASWTDQENLQIKRALLPP
jgi:hypothetical protein